MAAGNEMRVGDAEREAAAAELQEHFASGRLNQEELDERLTTAFAAKTRGDLNALFVDLPSSGRDWAGMTGPGGRASGAGGPFGGPGGFGPRGPFGAGGSGQPGWQASDGAWRASAGRGIGRLVFPAVMLWILLIVGILGIFGIGTGRPLGIVLVVAAFALLRRLLFMIFGRRRMCGRGPRRGPRRGRY